MPAETPDPIPSHVNEEREEPGTNSIADKDTEAERTATADGKENLREESAEASKEAADMTSGDPQVASTEKRSEFQSRHWDKLFHVT